MPSRPLKRVSSREILSRQSKKTNDQISETYCAVEQKGEVTEVFLSCS